MAYYTFLDSNNIVQDIITGRDETDIVEGITSWEEYYSNQRNMICKRASFNTRGGIHYTGNNPSPDQSKAFRKNFPAIGFSYDSSRDAFIPPKIYNSWILNENTCLWEPPIPIPSDGEMEGPVKYIWNDEEVKWEEAEYSYEQQKWIPKTN